MKSSAQEAIIIDYLTDHAKGTTADPFALLGVTPSRMKKLLYELVSEELFVPEGGNRNRTYRLKSLDLPAHRPTNMGRNQQRTNGKASLFSPPSGGLNILFI